ncbi:methyltransferase domain-containing protein [Egibacter rhizosphaerae]|uniref:Methyltransferase domain-containing protein n=1 Tax=Egibacter rhizosphaerae TaxID=1670831 RepID=A0A411YIZ0_9ACTN|nr:methyltransferase domain-containing protein [Egibacter rhizosphaerae]QBI21264.1 methyltransferase domain-containing protein [Egibacter rhizosphaerae]
MGEAPTFDPVSFKDGIRQEWRDAAPGWRDWLGTMETDDGSGALSRLLVDHARLEPGATVLDLGAGYGEPGLTAAPAVAPGGRILLQDIAGDMLATARERAAQADLGDVAVQFFQGDAEELELGAASVDAILSRSAIQYLVEPAGTLARLRRYCTPGARLSASVWGPPDRVGFAACLPVILDVLDLEPPPRGRPGPFALGDPQRLASVAADAGFAEIETGTVVAVWEFATREACTRFIRDVAPPVTALVDDQPSDVQEQVWRRVTEEAWEPFVAADGRIHLPNEALWIAATNPR